MEDGVNCSHKVNGGEMVKAAIMIRVYWEMASVLRALGEKGMTYDDN